LRRHNFAGAADGVPRHNPFLRFGRAEALEPPMSFAQHQKTYRFALRYWLASPRLFGLLIVARLSSNAVDTLIPLASGRLADSLIADSPIAEPRVLDAPLQALALLLSMVVAFHVLRNILAYSLIYVTTRGMEQLARDAFARVQRFSADWHANAFAGATVRKITRGMWALDQLSETLIFGVVPTATVTTGVMLLLLWRWPPLGGWVLLTLALFLIVSVFLSLYWVSPSGQAFQTLDSALGAQLADSITGNQVVKDFAAEAREDAALAKLARDWRDAGRRNWFRDNTAGLAQTAIMILMQAGLLGFGLLMWSRKALSAGDVVTLMGVQGLLNAYLRDFGQHLRNVQKAVNELEDVVAFSERAPDVREAPQAPQLKVTKGEIVFDAVRFCYPKAAAPLYENLSVAIRAGERVGLVGASGAGKTTFVKLLQRYFDVTGGRILIDGQDIAHVSLESLRCAIGVVAQEPILFHRPLQENIRFGRPSAARGEIMAAARRAHADLFIERLAAGYDTLVGERGVKLSGGERQRVAIARAILANAPVLVLDEATSSLDSVSELHIREAIDELSRGRTTLVIAHRLSTVRRLDRILVFDHGRIVEDGTHDELALRPGGVYRRLFETQSGDAARDAVF
jgi:ATP-binding cassette, subfamily B, bacterial